MSSSAAIAAVLHCVFSPVGQESGPEKRIGVMDARLNEEFAKDLASMSPPQAEQKYVGEQDNQREWVFHANDPEDPNGYLVVRLVPTRDIFNPYAFRMGKAVPAEGGRYRFEQMQSGTCQLMSEGQQPLSPLGMRP